MSPPARTPRPDAAGAFGTTSRCLHRRVSGRLLDADAPPSTGRTVARCAAKMRAPSKQVSCSGVRRKVPRRPPRWSRRVLTSRKEDSDRFGAMSQQQAHRGCTEPPDDASPRHRGSACPSTSPKPETDRPAASSHGTRPQRSTSRASRRVQRSPAELNKLLRRARDDVQRLGADGPGPVSPPDSAGSRHRCSARCVHRPDLSPTSASGVATTHVPSHQVCHTQPTSAAAPNESKWHRSFRRPRPPAEPAASARSPSVARRGHARAVSGELACRGGAERSGRDRRCLHPRRFTGRSPSSIRNACVFDAV